MSTSTTEHTVADAVRPLDRIAVVPRRAILKNALEEMSRFRLGIACVVDEHGVLAGIVTDGDVRRMLLRTQKPLAALLIDDVIVHANTAPTTVSRDEPLGAALAEMERLEVWDLPVVDSNGVLEGLLHLHPVVQLLVADGRS